MKDKSTKENNKKFNESIDFRLIFKYLFSKKNLFFIIFRGNTSNTEKSKCKI